MDEQLLRVENLSFAYDGEHDALADVSLKANAGQVIGLIGPNGSGKSTLLKCICNILSPAKQRVFVQEADIAALTPKARAQKIVYMPQRAEFQFDFTVEETVLMGRFAHPQTVDNLQIAQDCMRQTGVYPMRERFVTNLSGGEQQRVSLARTFAQSAVVLLLDEPTANLDIAHRLSVLQTVRQKVQSAPCCAVIALHDITLAAAFCDMLIVLQNGRILACGQTQTVMQSNVLQTVFGVPLLQMQHNGQTNYLFANTPLEGG